MKYHVSFRTKKYIYLRTCKGNCYGYINIRAFHGENETIFFFFFGVSVINRTLRGRLEIRNFSSRVKYFTRSLRSLVKYFSTLEVKFRISNAHVISSIYHKQKSGIR